MYRKRRGLSQDELAFLVGLESGPAVSRHEQNRHVVPVSIAFGYAMVFEMPVDELFTGLRQESHFGLRARAGRLLRRVRKEQPGLLRTRKLELLSALVESDEPYLVPTCDD